MISRTDFILRRVPSPLTSLCAYILGPSSDFTPRLAPRLLLFCNFRFDALRAALIAATSGGNKPVEMSFVAASLSRWLQAPSARISRALGAPVTLDLSLLKFVVPDQWAPNLTSLFGRNGCMALYQSLFMDRYLYLFIYAVTSHTPSNTTVSTPIWYLLGLKYLVVVVVVVVVVEELMAYMPKF